MQNIKKLLRDKLQEYFIKERINLAENNVSFTLCFFKRVFVYQMIFSMFGPLATPLILSAEGYTFTRNLGYIGCNSFLVFQTATWFVMASVAYCVFFVSDEYITEYYFFLLAMLMRNFIVAVRYGYMSKERYALLH